MAHNGNQARALAWLEDRPQGGCADELAAALGVTRADASEMLRLLGVAGKSVWTPDPKGKAHARKRHFALRHKPALVGKAAVAAKQAKSRTAGLRLDPSTPATTPATVKPVVWQPAAKKPVDLPAQSIFASMRFGSYLKGGWAERAYGGD